MSTRFVEGNWSTEIANAVRADPSRLWFVSPFIKEAALHRLLAFRPAAIQVLTRFSLEDFARGVSDLSALRALLNAGACVRGVRHLHAKLYLFGASSTIVTSANLTSAALDRNHEFGLISDDPSLVSASERYFGDLWERAGKDLTHTQLDNWAARLAKLVLGGRPSTLELPDYGADAGLRPAPAILPPAVAEAGRGFVKFLGEGDNRVSLAHETLFEVERSGCHWAVAYPRSKRPRAVRDGDLIFIGRLTYDPNDIVVFGRALGREHVPGRDDATLEEIARRPWKADWPRYVRVEQPEFVAGTLANGVSLGELMDELGASSFAPTQRNLEGDWGNTDPRRAYRQQPAVELTAIAVQWLNQRLQTQLERHGKIPHHTLASLDWP